MAFTLRHDDGFESSAIGTNLTAHSPDTLGSGYTSLLGGNITIRAKTGEVGQQARGASGTHVYRIDTGVTLAADQQVKFRSSDNSGGSLVLLRGAMGASDANGYSAHINSAGRLRLVRIDNGTITQIGLSNEALSPPNGTFSVNITVIAQGNQISATGTDGTNAWNVAAVTDTTYTSGDALIRIVGFKWLDDLKVWDQSAGGPSPASPVSETDTAKPAGATKNAIAGQAIETDSAKPAGARKIAVAGTVTETSIAQTAGAIKTAVAGKAIETDIAKPTASIQGLPAVNETDIAMPAGAAKVGLAGTVIDQSTGMPAGARKIGTALVARESSTVFAASAIKTALAGIARETDIVHAPFDPSLGPLTDVILAQYEPWSPTTIEALTKRDFSLINGALTIVVAPADPGPIVL